MQQNRIKLLIPGPVELTEEVLVCLAQPPEAHYGPAWAGLYRETTGLVAGLLKTQGDVFLMPGSGTTAIECCLANNLAPGDEILIGINGYFGEHMAEIARAYDARVIAVEAEWGEALSPEKIETAIRLHPNLRALALVHLESSTSITNPVKEICQVARKHGLPTVVDAVSSLGGLPLAMDEWGIDFCASASQKCLGAPPGLAPVAVGPQGWEFLERRQVPRVGWIHSLRNWRHYQDSYGDSHPTPATMPVLLVKALQISLQSLLAQGIDQRRAYYASLTAQLHEGLPTAGFRIFPDSRLKCPVITAAIPPAGRSTGEILNTVLEQYRLKIAGGLGRLKGKIIRIGIMSPAISGEDIRRLVNGLKEE